MAGGDLTNSFEKPAPRPRARPKELSDPQLHNRRDQLVQTFESAWGQIGFELRKCKNADDLIRIFLPLAEGYMQNTISVFCQPSTEKASAASVRMVRAKLRSLAAPLWRVDEMRRDALGRLQGANAALSQAPKNVHRLVKGERKKCRKEVWKAAQEYRTLSDSRRGLEVQLPALEASFARQELIRFLRSKRYALTPVNLANAAAGLPYMGWRRSMWRCTKEPCVIANGLNYQVFKSISYLAANARKRTEDTLVTSLREGIPLLPSRFRLPQAELAKDWLYLERAVRQAYRARPHPKALPFEITKRYLNQMRSRSQVDMVLAERAKLMLSKGPNGSPAT